MRENAHLERSVGVSHEGCVLKDFILIYILSFCGIDVKKLG